MKIAFFGLFCLICTQASVAEIFKWVDSEGVMHYSESKPEKSSYTSVQIPSYPSVSILDEEQVDDHDRYKKTQKYTPLVRKDRVVIYTTQSCGYCKKAKAYFKTNKIAYKEYAIDSSEVARARYDKLGATGVPVIFVGKKRMNGFSEARFKQIYSPHSNLP